jgi:hypothetical protein
MGKLATLAFLGVTVSVMGTGCSFLGPTRGDACVDWVRFADRQDQFTQAALVAVGKLVRPDGETSIYGYTAQTHLVEIETIYKGTAEQDAVRISSMPQTCSGGESYPKGDPLDTNQRVLIFAIQQDHKWFTMTPEQGVIPFEQGTPLPFKSS